jgi:two-component system response regulator (stage 0 sporulation protein F)
MLKKINILIMDAERNSSSSMQEFLLSKGYRAITASSTRQGFSILKSEEIELLVLDMNFPGENGMDILKEVKKNYPKMEVIIISSEVDIESFIRAMRLGALDYIRKPFSHVEFQIAIQRMRKFLDLNRKLIVMEEQSPLVPKSPGEISGGEFTGESSNTNSSPPAEGGNKTSEVQEQEIILLRTALRNHSYNQKATAEALGISRDSLIRKMKKYNIRIKKEDLC